MGAEFIDAPSVRLVRTRTRIGSPDRVSVEIDFPSSSWLDFSEVLAQVGGFEVSGFRSRQLRFLAPDPQSWDGRDSDIETNFLNELGFLCDAASAFYDDWNAVRFREHDLTLGLTMALLRRRLVTAQRSSWESALQQAGKEVDRSLLRALRSALSP